MSLNRNTKSSLSVQARRPRRNRRAVNEHQSVDAIMRTRIPRNLMRSSPVPPFRKVKLIFKSTSVIQGAAPFVVSEIRINGAFSPDTVGTPSGFNEWATMYTLYQVMHVRLKFSVAANEPAVPVNFAFIFRDIQPSTIINTFAKATNAVEVAPTTGPKIVGETTGMSIYNSPWYDIDPAAIIGNAFSYYGNAAYGAAVTANPTALVWAAFILTSFQAATNLTNGAFLSLYVELSTRFYSGAVLEI